MATARINANADQDYFAKPAKESPTAKESSAQQQNYASHLGTTLPSAKYCYYDLKLQRIFLLWCVFNTAASLFLLAVCIFQGFPPTFPSLYTFTVWEAGLTFSLGVELVLDLAIMHKDFWSDPWHVFDLWVFFLSVLSVSLDILDILGVQISIAAEIDDSLSFVLLAARYCTQLVRCVRMVHSSVTLKRQQDSADTPIKFPPLLPVHTQAYAPAPVGVGVSARSSRRAFLGSYYTSKCKKRQGGTQGGKRGNVLYYGTVHNTHTPITLGYTHTNLFYAQPGSPLPPPVAGLVGDTESSPTNILKNSLTHTQTTTHTHARPPRPPTTVSVPRQRGSKGDIGWIGGGVRSPPFLSASSISTSSFSDASARARAQKESEESGCGLEPDSECASPPTETGLPFDQGAGADADIESDSCLSDSDCPGGAPGRAVSSWSVVKGSQQPVVCGAVHVDF